MKAGNRILVEMNRCTSGTTRYDEKRATKVRKHRGGSNRQRNPSERVTSMAGCHSTGPGRRTLRQSGLPSLWLSVLSNLKGPDNARMDFSGHKTEEEARRIKVSLVSRVD